MLPELGSLKRFSYQVSIGLLIASLFSLVHQYGLGLVALFFVSGCVVFIIAKFCPHVLIPFYSVTLSVIMMIGVALSLLLCMTVYALVTLPVRFFKQGFHASASSSSNLQITKTANLK